MSNIIEESNHLRIKYRIKNCFYQITKKSQFLDYGFKWKKYFRLVLCFLHCFSPFLKFVKFHCSASLYIDPGSKYID